MLHICFYYYHYFALSFTKSSSLLYHTLPPTLGLFFRLMFYSYDLLFNALPYICKNLASIMPGSIWISGFWTLYVILPYSVPYPLKVFRHLWFEWINWPPNCSRSTYLWMTTVKFYAGMPAYLYVKSSSDWSDSTVFEIQSKCLVGSVEC